MPCGVMYIGADGIIEYVNGEACALLDADEDRLLGRAFSDAFPGDGEGGFFAALRDALFLGLSFSKRVVTYGDFRLYVSASQESGGGGAVFMLEPLRTASAKESAMVYINELNRQLEARNKLIADTFGRYLSDDVVKSLLENPKGLNLGGKKCRITVLMSDLRGFTALSEDMKPEDVLSMLNAYLGAMVDIISKRGGTIIEFIGDSVFAIFGAPYASDDHAQRAVACAVEMQCAMARVNAYNAEHGYPSLEMGIGINTGEMIVGNIGSYRRMKYGVVGRHVNLCGRIESYSVGGQILVSPDTYKSLDAPAHVDDTITVSPKGVKQPITLYSIDGLGAPYNVSCRREDRPVLRRLITPAAFEANILREKYIAPETLSGEFTKLSAIEAEIDINAQLHPMDNLRLKKTENGRTVFEEVFAKVIKRTESGYLIHFTARNKAFDAFAGEHLKAR